MTIQEIKVQIQELFEQKINKSLLTSVSGGSPPRAIWTHSQNCPNKNLRMGFEPCPHCDKGIITESRLHDLENVLRNARSEIPKGSPKKKISIVLRESSSSRKHPVQTYTALKQWMIRNHQDNGAGNQFPDTEFIHGISSVDSQKTKFPFLGEYGCISRSLRASLQLNQKLVNILQNVASLVHDAELNELLANVAVPMEERNEEVEPGPRQVQADDGVQSPVHHNVDEPVNQQSLFENQGQDTAQDIDFSSESDTGEEGKNFGRYNIPTSVGEKEGTMKYSGLAKRRNRCEELQRQYFEKLKEVHHETNKHQAMISDMSNRYRIISLPLFLHGYIRL